MTSAPMTGKKGPRHKSYQFLLEDSRASSIPAAILVLAAGISGKHLDEVLNEFSQARAFIKQENPE